MFKKSLPLFVVLCVVFIDVMGVGLVYPMFSSMIFHKEFQLLPLDTSDSVRGFYLGLLLASMPLTQFFSAPIIGTISDRKGRKSLLLLSLLITVCGYLIGVVAVYITNLALLIFSRIVVGISAGSIAVAAAAIADVSTTENKAKNFGLFNMAAGIGFTVGPFLGGVLTQIPFPGVQGYSVPFLFAAIVAGINLLLVFLYFQETHKTPRIAPISFMMGLKNLKKAFQITGLKALFAAFFIFCFGWSFFYEFIPVTWIGFYGFDASMIGTLFAYGAGFYALSCGLLIRPIVDRFKVHRILFYSLIILGLYFPIMLLRPDPWILWFYLPPLQLFLALIFPTTTTMVSNSTTEDMQGEILGLMQSVEAFGFAISPLVAGVFLGISEQMPIIIGAIAMLLAAFILGRAFRREVFKK